MGIRIIGIQHNRVAARSAATDWARRWAALQGYLWLTLPLFAIPALWPFFSEGLPRSYDGGLHLLRIGLLDDYLRQGMLFPRWAPDLLLGNGYPLFNYYAPASYYLVIALHWLGLDFYYAFVAALGLIVLLAGWGMYQWASDLFGARLPALVAAVAYLYTPYLLTNVFIRGAIAEAAAQALLPWIFWSARRLFYSPEPVRLVLPLALSLGTLAVTHNITLLFTPAVLMGYLLWLWWQRGRDRLTLGWAISALILAAGGSAFFWLPLALERRYLADTAYTIAQSVWLPGSVWTWQNFLDWGWTFHHTFERPIRLGLVQVLLAVLGFGLGWRRRDEWWYWLGVTFLTVAMMASWALPLWLNNDILTVAQFTWRLLSILSLPLALFVGGLMVRIRPVWAQWGLAAAVIAIVIVAHQPRLGWIDVFDPEGTDVSLPVFTQTEVNKGVLEAAEHTSSVQEFRPRWVDETLTLVASGGAPPGTQPPIGAIRIERANAFALEARITTAAATPVRFSNFYFPGWQVLLNGATALTPYPSTNLGLLTVDLPAGEHELLLRWQGTALHRVGAIISWLALMGLGWLCWRERTQRRWLWLPLLLLLSGLTATFSRPALAVVEQPKQTAEADGLQLLGYRTTIVRDAVYLYPYWYVNGNPPERVRVRWQIQDLSGRVHAEQLTYPYFNSYRADNFPIGAVVDDAYRIALPAGLTPGQYWLALSFGESERDRLKKPLIVGEVTLTTTPPHGPLPRQSLDIRFGESVRLAGYDARLRDRGVILAHGRPAVVNAGAYLTLRLYWQAMQAVPTNYHGFVHLVDNQSQVLTQEDHLPGPFFRPPLLWDSYHLQTDSYLLRIPADAPSGLYWPLVGMYDFETLERLPAYIDRDQDLGYDYRLPPVKVVNSPAARPTQPVQATFSELAELLGYDLTPESTVVRPGDTLTLTLYYRSQTPTRVNYTRFLHLYDAERGMAAQSDGLPQAGLNPTWSWQPAEVIADSVTLAIAASTPPGDYTLYLGFYDPKHDSARLPAYTAAGTPIADDRVPLAQITVQR